MSKKCIVHGRNNYSHQGEFHGDICLPCYRMITEGDASQISTNFIYTLWKRKPLKPGHIGIENMVEAILALQKRHGYDKGIRMWLRDNAKPDKVYCPVISLEEDDEQFGGF